MPRYSITSSARTTNTRRNGNDCTQQPRRVHAGDARTGRRFRKDPQCIQWRDIAKSAFLFQGKNLSFAEVQAMMKPGLAEHEMIDGKPVWGWWRLTDLGYATFMRTP